MWTTTGPALVGTGHKYIQLKQTNCHQKPAQNKIKCNAHLLGVAARVPPPPLPTTATEPTLKNPIV